MNGAYGRPDGFDRQGVFRGRKRLERPQSARRREPEPSPDVTPRPAPQRPARQPDPEPQAPEAETEDFVRPPASQPAAEEPAPARATDFGAVASGDWVVQIASFRTTADAEAAWLAFQGRFSDISSGLAPDVASVDLGDRGTYHRLRIAAFASRDDANRFCSTLQSRGQDCLVARR